MKIKNKEEFKEADSRLALKKISADEIVILDVDDIWDGPLSGFCMFNNKKYLFYCFDQLEGDDDRWPRKYLLIELTQEQLAEHQKQDAVYHKWRSGSISQQEYQEIFETFQPQTIDKGQIIGWFDAGVQGGNLSKFMKSYFEWREKNQ